jgi:hypothetical protein
MTMGTTKELTPSQGEDLVPHKPVNFRRSDLQRALRGAREEGLDIERVEVAKDGGFTLYPKLVITTVEDAAKQAWHEATEKLTAKKSVGKIRPIKKGKQAKR